MNLVSLGEVVAELESGSRPQGGTRANKGEIPSIGAEHLSEDGGFCFSNIRRIPQLFFDGMRTGKIKPHDILLVNTGSVGKVSYVSPDFPFRASVVSNHVFRIAIRAQVADPKYVFRYLQSPRGQTEILKLCRGSVIVFIDREFIDHIKFPLPPLAAQRRIAAILDQADAIRRKQQRAIALADTFLRATFLHIFGDPVTNPMGWEVYPLGEICRVVRGSSPRPKADPRYYGGTVPRLMVKDITRDGLSVNPRLDSLTQVGAALSRPVPAGTLVMVVSCDVGTVSRLEVAACIHDGIVALLETQTEVIEPTFLLRLLHQLKKRQKSLEEGSVFKNITTSQVKKIPIPIPPLERQAKFVRLVHQVERPFRRAVERANQELERTFAALIQQAFRGEL